MNNSILVPHDFTEEANYALEHAYMIGKIYNNPIHLLHVVDRSQQVDEAKSKLDSIAADFKKDHNIEILTEIRVGNLFEEVYKYGTEIDASLGVMGTHGRKNLKKAMKLIKQFIKTPFILVQSPVLFGEYDRILIPIDSDINSRIKVQWVRYINTLFESKVYIIAHKEKDGFKIKKLNNNLKFTEDWFNNELIDYEINLIDSSKDFADSIFNYANEVESDIILMMTDKYKSYIKAIKKAESMELYKKIPIMCVNKRTDIIKFGGFN